MTYSSLFSIDKVCTTITIYALNDLYVSYFYTRNAYLNVDTDEKVYFIYGQ